MKRPQTLCEGGRASDTWPRCQGAARPSHQPSPRLLGNALALHNLDRVRAAAKRPHLVTPREPLRPSQECVARATRHSQAASSSSHLCRLFLSPSLRLQMMIQGLGENLSTFTLIVTILELWSISACLKFLLKILIQPVLLEMELRPESPSYAAFLGGS